MAQFKHVGVPVAQRRPGMVYIEAARAHITNPDEDTYGFEYLCFEEGSPMPAALQTETHIAFLVDDLSAALAGQELVVEPFQAMPTLRCAFIRRDGVLVEVMQETCA